MFSLLGEGDRSWPACGTVGGKYDRPVLAALCAGDSKGELVTGCERGSGLVQGRVADTAESTGDEGFKEGGLSSLPSA